MNNSSAFINIIGHSPIGFISPSHSDFALHIYKALCCLPTDVSVIHSTQPDTRTGTNDLHSIGVSVKFKRTEPIADIYFDNVRQRSAQDIRDEKSFELRKNGWFNPIKIRNRWVKSYSRIVRDKFKTYKV